MRYSFVVWMFTNLCKIPVSLWCYFVHSWTRWHKSDYSYGEYLYYCDCGRKWGYLEYPSPYC